MTVELNPAQRDAVAHGEAPLLIIAGAGSGKTNTLAHRVGRLLLDGADPGRILLLTFTRRAALEMTRRAERIAGAAARLHWAGTFHAVANRLLRLHAVEIGLDPAFTVLDRSDSADLLDVIRHDLGFSKAKRRFPQKGTCLAIYSRVVDTQAPLDACLRAAFPWCAEWTAELGALFEAYVERKQRAHVLDYDDLLLYWREAMRAPSVAERVRRRFDHVLVDEYQDTNALQAEILLALKPDGRGLTVVGDDAQAIYGFRAATVRNILDFPSRFTPPATVVTLAQNYRSTQPILAAANAVIALARERYAKELFSARASSQKPVLAIVDDEARQADYVADRVLAAREAGTPLKRQAVLFRAAHHSGPLEIELSRRNIPFVKFGGLKFLEAAHVKDVVCVLRLGENLRDEIAAFRVLKLLPGVGPAAAQRILRAVADGGASPAALAAVEPPPAAREAWPPLCALLAALATAPWEAQLGLVRRWYQPHLDRLYDGAPLRARDLEQLEQIGAGFDSRERFLSELTLDPPSATSDEAGDPLLDEDYLVLSTIHSAKGQEWDAVYLLNATDGCIPSDLAAGEEEQLEEERRLLYVAMTRARDALHVVQPHRFYVGGARTRHVYAQRTRFLPDGILHLFERRAEVEARPPDAAPDPADRPAATAQIAARLKSLWRVV